MTMPLTGIPFVCKAWKIFCNGMILQQWVAYLSKGLNELKQNETHTASFWFFEALAVAGVLTNQKAVYGATLRTTRTTPHAMPEDCNFSFVPFCLRPLLCLWKDLVKKGKKGIAEVGPGQNPLCNCSNSFQKCLVDAAFDQVGLPKKMLSWNVSSFLLPLLNDF